MLALTFHGPREVRCERVPDAALESPGDALVAVERAAICGSDLHVYHGREHGLDPGTVMGHEFAGRVVAVGAEVRGLRLGQRVASPFTTCCGECFYCAGGLPARCERGQLFGWVEGGRGLQGAQAELVRVPLAESTLVPLPDDVDLAEGLLLGDVLATGCWCAELGGVGPGQVVAVVGCGPVGLMAVVGARERGAATILAVDGVAERLALAARLGARAVDRAVEDPLEAVRSATEGRGADVVLELVGSPAAARLAFELVRPGGTIAAAGVHTEARFGFTPAEAYERNLTYRAGRCPARRMIDVLLPLVRLRRYPLAELLTHDLPLAEGPAGYAMFDEKREGCIKVLLDPAGSPSAARGNG